MEVSTRYLTKSLFKKALKCPRKLYYALSSNYKEETVDGLRQSLIDEGKMIGAYSRLLFPEGIDLDGNGAANELVAQTIELLESHPSVTIFEAAIQTENCFIRADILHKSLCGDLHLMEVKAKSWDATKGFDQIVNKKGNVRSVFLRYIRDIAFQKLVAQESFPDRSVSASLILPDKSKINTIPGLYGLFQQDEHGDFWLDDVSRQLILDANEMLVTEVEVDALVDKVLGDTISAPGITGAFRDVVVSLAEILRDDGTMENLSPPIGSHCRYCEFRTCQNNSGFDLCWSTSAGLSSASQDRLTIDLYHGGKSIDKFISNEQYLMSDLEPTDFGLDENGKDPKKKGLGMSQSEKQCYQAQNTNTVVLDRDYLYQEMESWEYPLHFVNFETFSSALPFTTNKRPWATSAFQFSHHTLDRDGIVTHTSEFLHAIPGQCPNGLFLRAFAEAMGNCTGTIFRWGAHENTTLSSLLSSETSTDADLDVLESLVAGGERAMVDLTRILTKGIYVPGSAGSSSLKKLLLPTMKMSSYLHDFYSQPYNGTNFKKMRWWQVDAKSGDPVDPYSLLEPNREGGPSSNGVTDGGDAIVAFKALQSQHLEAPEREAIESSLLRYCELDTLAMVMIVQGLHGFLDDTD